MANIWLYQCFTVDCVSYYYHFLNTFLLNDSYKHNTSVFDKQLARNTTNTFNFIYSAHLMQDAYIRLMENYFPFLIYVCMPLIIRQCDKMSRSNYDFAPPYVVVFGLPLRIVHWIWEILALSPIVRVQSWTEYQTKADCLMKDLLGFPCWPSSHGMWLIKDLFDCEFTGS